MIFKRGKFYWYEFEFRGRRHRATTGVPVGKGIRGEESPKEKAKQIEAAKRTELALGNAGIKKRPPSPQFSEFVKRFEKRLVAERADKPNTVQFYKDRIRQLLLFDKLKHAPLDLIDEQLMCSREPTAPGNTPSERRMV